MNWIELTEASQIDSIKEMSYQKPQVIFKHSVRCSISSVIKHRLEKSSNLPDIDFYFLDLVKHRGISDKISEIFSVYHESPQVLLIKKGECVYDESHSSITMDEIVEQAA